MITDGVIRSTVGRPDAIIALVSSSRRVFNSRPSSLVKVERAEAMAGIGSIVPARPPLAQDRIGACGGGSITEAAGIDQSIDLIASKKLIEALQSSGFSRGDL